MPLPNRIRRLLIVLGDQLDRRNPLLEELDPQQDIVWMAESGHEARHVWSHKARIALFLAAMRHFRDALRATGVTVVYRSLGQQPDASLGAALSEFLGTSKPAGVWVTQPGDYRVLQEIQRSVAQAGLTLQVTPDRHFLCSDQEFSDWAAGRKQLRMEHFYRYMRRNTGILMNADSPLGGQWNFDADNRKSFSARGPGELPPWPAFPPDRTTREVITVVNRSFPDHPGTLSGFDWPVDREQALLALEDFIHHRLGAFGPHQDAMWTDEPFLYHSGLSAALNLKLLDPAEVIEAAVEAFAQKRLPLASVEGFVRQILGWREFVRGFYWKFMPDLEQANALGAHAVLPGFYWNAETDMQCLRQTLDQILTYGYAHHIQRLMVTGLFALLLGVEPQRLHRWYLAMFVDAVEWVELPNTLGMSQYADGGGLASKPYVASGRYIERMSNYCSSCRYDPAKSVGEDACPFTTLYWDFLQRHRHRFHKHPRTALQWRNLERLDAATRKSISHQADDLRNRFAQESSEQP